MEFYRRTVAPECVMMAGLGMVQEVVPEGLRRELVEVMTCESEGLGGEGRSRDVASECFSLR